MRRRKGIIFGVCSTIGKFLGIEPWILRIFAVCFFSGVVSAYIALAIIFAFVLDSEEEVLKKEKRKAKREQKKLEASKTEYIKKEDFTFNKEFSERPNGNLMKN